MFDVYPNYAEHSVVVCFFPGWKQNHGSKQCGFPKLFSNIFGFRKVREAGSFHVSNFRLKHTSWCRVMTKNKKITSIKSTSTPCALDKKTPNFAQGLDFLLIFLEKTKERKGKNTGPPHGYHNL